MISPGECEIRVGMLVVNCPLNPTYHGQCSIDAGVARVVCASCWVDLSVDNPRAASIDTANAAHIDPKCSVGVRINKYLMYSKRTRSPTTCAINNLTRDNN